MSGFDLQAYLELHFSDSLAREKELSSISTLGAGGRAEFFIEPSRLEDIRQLFMKRSEEKFPLYLLGGGTNVVFADGLVEGVVLSTRRLNAVWWRPYDTYALLDIEAGYSLSLVVSETVKEGFSGAEFALGIPGTVGGALAGNAGTGGKSVGDLLEEVTTVEEDGALRKWKREEFAYSYRNFSLTRAGRLIAGCRMKFERNSRVEIDRMIQYFRNVRSIQPHGARSAGCTFKNPPEESAGRLMDICGCKGLRVGGAVVSENHANFIVNSGGATGDDVWNLMKLCRDIVMQKKGLRLEPEIRFLGFPE